MATTTRSTTTSTTTYNLSTYRYQQDEPGVLRPSVPTSVWTNHPATNPPTLRVSTEITRAANGSGGSGGVGAFESVIIKVLDGNRGGRGGIAVLEEVDLLTFSRTQNKGNNTLLKGVYRGNQVAFRYLHPLDAAPAAQHYNRFQLTFKHEKDAAEFVESLRPVCPFAAASNEPAQSQARTTKLPAKPPAKTPAKPPAPAPAPTPTPATIKAKATAPPPPPLPVPVLQTQTKISKGAAARQSTIATRPTQVTPVTAQKVNQNATSSLNPSSQTPTAKAITRTGTSVTPIPAKLLKAMLPNNIGQPQPSSPSITQATFNLSGTSGTSGLSMADRNMRGSSPPPELAAFQSFLKKQLEENQISKFANSPQSAHTNHTHPLSSQMPPPSNFHPNPPSQPSRPFLSSQVTQHQHPLQNRPAFSSFMSNSAIPSQYNPFFDPPSHPQADPTITQRQNHAFQQRQSSQTPRMFHSHSNYFNALTPQYPVPPTTPSVTSEANASALLTQPPPPPPPTTQPTQPTQPTPPFEETQLSVTQVTDVTECSQPASVFPPTGHVSVQAPVRPKPAVTAASVLQASAKATAGASAGATTPPAPSPPSSALPLVLATSRTSRMNDMDKLDRVDRVDRMETDEEVEPQADGPAASISTTLSDIYNLPLPQLEKMIAEVIHEPDFLDFMEKLDQIYMLKGLLRR